jgi:hypothetical protein
MQLNDKDREFITQSKTFYKGVIEANDDPLQIGRVRVRVLELHSASIIDVPTNTLPWANIIQPLSFGGFNSGFGISGVPITGTWVWCFVDLKDTNNIVVIGAISGINTEKSSNQGFSDPTGTYPVSNTKDINARVRVSDASYTKTYTIETPNHHIIEIDDLNGNILIKHSNGANVKLHNAGIDAVFNASSSIKITDNQVDIIGNVNIIGDTNVTGTVVATENIKSDKDVIATTVSLKTHKHLGVVTGGGQTGVPVG